MPAATFNYQVRQGADGAITVSTSTGARLVLRGDGVCADLSAISTVGVKHLDQVASHTVNTIAGSCSHVIRFVNGALLQYAYNDAGQLIELSGDGLACTITRDNELLFSLPGQ